jgi:hypothetical protein
LPYVVSMPLAKTRYNARMAEVQKPNRRRWGWLQWGTLGFLVYLWSWMIFWALFRFDLLPDRNYETLRTIGAIVYFPILLLGALINWIR